MRHTTSSRSAALQPRVIIALSLIAAAGLLCSWMSFAASPANGTLSPSNPQLTYTGGPFTVPTNRTDSAGGPVTCDQADPCDDFNLTTNIPQSYISSHPNELVKIEVTWSDPTSQQDLDAFLVNNPDDGKYPAHATNAGDNPEVISVPLSKIGAGTHTFFVRVIPFVSTGQPFTTTITLVSPPAPTPTPTPSKFTGIAPRYYNYSPGPGVGENAGEPSIGYNPATGNIMFLAGLQTLRVTLPEKISPAGSVPSACGADWTDVSYVFTKTRSADPILFTDQHTGRTFVSQLNTVTQTNPVLIGLNSLMAYTDDDGATWTPSQLNPPDGSNDHQTVGAGPYPAALAAALANPVNKGDAVYYCGQAGYVLAATGAAYCSRSDDGGLNFNKSVIAYQDVVSGCAQSIHGHVKVGPDGTVYLPNASCNGNVAVAVSMDAGTTWTLKQVPNTIPTPAILDPSVAIANDNTVYLFFIGKPAAGSADGHVYAAKSTDHGDTWSAPVDIGASAGIANAVFPTGVAGDGDRAACGFLGTTTSGDHQNKDFKGTWYGFVAHTYDGGKTWVTVDATPSGPVQREACIWNGGGNNVCRNLLDFVDITKDSKGRVLFGMADGCINECETGGPNSYSAKALIARQSGGKGLLKQFDPLPVEPVQPAPPCLFGRRDDSASYLKWVTPDTGGSEITQYKIFRAAAAGGPAGTETQVGVAGGNKNTFTDRSVDPSVVKYTYRITAVNARGESIPSNSVDLTITPRVEATGACGLPGVQVISDPTGDETDTLAQHDITSVSLSEPPGFPNKLIFTIKVASLPSIPPGWRWAVRFSVEGVTPPTDATGGPSEDFFVSMVTSDGPTPTFTYGVTSVPQNAARVFTTIGDLDAASNANADGTITLVIDKANIGSPKAGQGIVGLLGSVRATAPSAIPGSGGTNETIPDSTGGGSYQLRSANLCLPNTAPVARLTANKDEGDKPLSVTFDGSASSDPDKNDKIATYIFNLGDGSDDIVQATPTLTHNFNKTGEYLVRMVVIDSRGKTSDNTAQWFLEVNDPNVVNPTPTPGSTATPTPGQSPTPGPSATPTPSTSPSATPVQRAQLLNISTRLRVETGDNALIGGFIVTGGSKSVLLRAIGPSLNDKGTPLAGRIDDTVLELHGPNGALITTNDNWKDAPNRADIEATGIPPKDDRESAILRSLTPGKYTAIVRGKNDTTGIALVEAYDLAPSGSQLANISTRGLVETGNDVMIGGFISGNQTGPSKLLVRALGPSLSNQLPNALDDPTLELYDANGTTLAVDDDWKDVQASEIQDTGIPPSNDLESAIVRMLPAGKYTAVVRGVHNHTGSALVEVYNLP